MSFIGRLRALKHFAFEFEKVQKNCTYRLPTAETAYPSYTRGGATAIAMDGGFKRHLATCTV